MTSILRVSTLGSWLAVLGLFVQPDPGATGGDQPQPPRTEVAPEEPLTGRTPLTVTLEPNAALHEHIQEVAAAAPGDDRDVYLTIRGIVPPRTRAVGIRIFLNAPGADRRTPLEDPSYVASVAFGQGDGRGPKPENFVVELGPTLRRLRAARELPAGKPLAVTLVAVPLRPGDSIDGSVMPVARLILSVGPEGTPGRESR